MIIVDPSEIVVFGSSTCRPCSVAWSEVKASKPEERGVVARYQDVTDEIEKWKAIPVVTLGGKALTAPTREELQTALAEFYATRPKPRPVSFRWSWPIAGLAGVLALLWIYDK